MYTYIQVLGVVQSTVMSTTPFWVRMISSETQMSDWKPEKDVCARIPRTGWGVMMAAGGGTSSAPHDASPTRSVPTRHRRTDLLAPLFIRKAPCATILGPSAPCVISERIAPLERLD